MNNICNSLKKCKLRVNAVRGHFVITSLVSAWLLYH